MSSTENEISGLIRKIESIVVDLPQQNIIFLHGSDVYHFCTDVPFVETGNKSHMSLERFGEKYGVQALKDLLHEIYTPSPSRPMHILEFIVNKDSVRFSLSDPDSEKWRAGYRFTEREIFEKNIRIKTLRLLEKNGSISAVKGSVEDIRRIKAMKLKGTYEQTATMVDLWKRLSSNYDQPKTPLDFYKTWLGYYGVVFFGERLAKTMQFQELKKKYDPKELGKTWDEMFDKMTKSKYVKGWKHCSVGGKEYRTFYNNFLRHFGYLKKQNLL